MLFESRSVLDQRPVAGLAVYVRVLSDLLLVLHVRMTGFAGVVAGKLGRPGSDLSDGSTTIVSVLSEASWDDVVSHHQKDQEGEYEESRKSK